MFIQGAWGPPADLLSKETQVYSWTIFLGDKHKNDIFAKIR